MEKEPFLYLNSQDSVAYLEVAMLFSEDDQNLICFVIKVRKLQLIGKTHIMVLTVVATFHDFSPFDPIIAVPKVLLRGVPGAL